MEIDLKKTFKSPAFKFLSVGFFSDKNPQFTMLYLITAGRIEYQSGIEVRNIFFSAGDLVPIKILSGAATLDLA